MRSYERKQKWLEQGKAEAQNDIKLARRCMDFKLIKCDNKDCLNLSCPLNIKYG